MAEPMRAHIPISEELLHERILAELQVYADQLNEGGVWAVVGIPPWMGPSPAWLEVADA